MIGNDVVDLGDSETSAEMLHPRFDARVFDPSELHALRDATSPERRRWIFWAAKESAYKAAKQLDPFVVFSPVRFVVTLDDDLRGRVVHAGREFQVRIDVEGDALHAVAGPDPEPGVERISGLGPVLARDGVAPSEWPGMTARRLCTAAAANRLGCDPSELEIVRQGALPHLRLSRASRDRPELASTAVSLSHHGRYAAFACELALLS